MNDLLHSFFSRATDRWPDHIAVDEPPSADRSERRLLTYRELDSWSNALALGLGEYVASECVVAVLLPRSAEVYAAQLAVLKSGAAYTCIDPSFPDERARWLLDDAAAVALITNAEGIARAQAAGWTVPLIDISRFDASSDAPGRDTAPAAPWLTPQSLAYLIYTSGTTGRPKGVAIEHRGISNLVASDLEEFVLGPGDRVGQNSSTSYDSSVEELWLALAAGATVVVVDDETARLGPDVVPWLRRERLTVFCPPPTLLRATGCANPAQELPELKLLYVGGEALSRDVADTWAPGRRLSNGYGPTECSVTAIRGDIQAGDAIAIGHPVPGVTAVILDEALNDVPTGERGELCIGGAGLARGYWRRPELTADRFVAHPRFGRLYRTGDLAHQDESGVFFCHGRLDSQVKVRGYRIELDEIDAQLLLCEGVREAATAVQSAGAQATIVACVVANDPDNPPSAATLRAQLSAVLPSYMVPTRIGFVTQMPRTVGGKLHRAALPDLIRDELAGSNEAPLADTPASSELERAIAAHMRHVLGLTHDVSVDRDFFTALGGDSLTAAMLVTRLREHASTSWIAVRDIYDARTVRALAARAPATTASSEPLVPASASSPVASNARSTATTTIVQCAWLVVEHLTASGVAYVAALVFLPWLTSRLTLVQAIALLPLLLVIGTAAYAPFAVLLAALVKRMLIGRYEPITAPVWSSFYLRHWMVVSVARLIPWRVLQGTSFHAAALRALGARIGQRVHIHRGVDLTHGGWDLLDIGDDVSIGQDVSIGVIELDGGNVVAGPVSIGNGAVLEVRAGLAAHTSMGADAQLTALSSLPSGMHIPAGERWDGIPATCVGRAAAAPRVAGTAMSAMAHGLLMMAAHSVVSLLKYLPVVALMLLICVGYGIDAGQLWQWLQSTDIAWRPAAAWIAVLVASVPLTLVVDAAVMRALGRVTPGVIHLQSAAYARVWIKTGLLDSAGNWLSGTLFWPIWLRAAGMTVGRGCEISTITDVVPELVTFGDDVFFADGIYLAGPRVQRGTVTLAATTIGSRSFVGNHVVIPAGQHLPDDILIGVCTVADDRIVRPGTSWFGLPPFELPRREVVEADRRLTHDPTPIRYWNRVFWEAARVLLPIVPALVAIEWMRTVVAASAQSVMWLVAVVVPLASLQALLTMIGVVLAMKWLLIGRVRPGQHPLWSCWCSRWDFLYVAWNQYASPALGALEGTLLLPWYLRAMGMTIGKGVVLGPGFAQVVDPDMIHIEDGATVHAMFQAHTFEDRVLKIDHVHIRRNATLATATVVLYGADIGAGAHVAPHSVVMKQERLGAGRRYEGAPTRG